ncbi:nuclear transport factor 2 family protein [Nitrincola tibetensis]|uniref:Nuclear transport factor 2 family protein n=1 Tax=Nitrincola tibetensis TaxID=2219697 RepID=A0A364NL77_9GAMM|nr:nuclear transport factor 2 family protein [Nitrincola tibetensis]RAU17635.1 nuclear transport factor 2 family protein [Nitrincola tibetensis]
MTTLSNQTVCAAYASVFSQLSLDTIESFRPLVSSDIRFKDPFNDHRGFEKMANVLQDMFKHTQTPSFSVFEQDVCGDHAWLRWRFTANIPVVGAFESEGISRLAFNAEGKVCEHIDYWDSAPLYMQIPLLGRVLKAIRKRMASDH